MKYVYLATEGPQDVEFIGRLLKHAQFRRVTEFTQLADYWHKLIPRTFPNKKGELNRPVSIPVFFSSPDAWIAVQSAGSDSQIVSTVEGTLAISLPAPLDAIGALLDADSAKQPLERFNEVRVGLMGLGLSVAAQPGLVSTTPPRCGVFVLPDNQTAGTLEDLLHECAAIQYPVLLKEAQSFVGRISPEDSALSKEDVKEFRKPAGLKKATVASISAVLKPGRTLQVSLQDNRWLEDASLDLTRVVAVRRFLDELLGVQAPTRPP